MRRRLALVVAGILFAGLAGAVPAIADDHEDDGGGTLMILGDSVAAGTQQPEPFTRGFQRKLFRELRDEYDFDSVVNLACPGDDTTEMVDGIGGASPFGSACYGPFAQLRPGGSSQLDVALAYLEENPGEVGLITITVGANDILACDLEDPDVQACIGEQLGLISVNLPYIIARLMVAAPGVPIVGTNYYNPNLAFWLVDPAIAEASLALTPVFNGVLEAVYGAFGVPVADLADAFKTFKTNGKPIPNNVKAICRLTLMCEKSGGDWILSDYDPNTPGPQTDIHPSNRGYRKIAATIFEVVEGEDLLDD